MIAKKDAQWIAPVLLYDATDGKTAETGITYSAVTVKYSRNGGAWATLTMSSGNWTEVGDGHYVVTFPAVGAIDTLGTFQFIVTDNLTAFLDYNGAATIVSGTNTELETKIDTIKDTDLPAVKVDTAAILVDTGTTLPTSIAAIPTATEIDTELTTAHGSGAWTDSAGTGVNTVVIHTKDGSSVDIEGVKISIHNSSNDDSPLIATGTTDADGNATISLDSATYYVRGYKAGYSFAATSITISGSSTEELTGTSITISAPADPDLCRLYFYPKTLGNAAISDLLVYISSSVAFAKLDDILISNQTKKFTYDSGDDKYYFDALQGASVKIECPELWSGVKSVVTPSESTYSLYDLI